ncbi:MAG: sulfatase-like hydrolase/transferase [Verrucomicrobiales bacterium]
MRRFCQFRFVIHKLGFISSLLLSLAFGAGATAERPNIVLLMADDLGWGDVGFNGNTTIRTPHLDEMAAAGAKLGRFYSAAPVCSPTRGSCLTGRHPFRYGIYSANTGHMKPAEQTLAELLKRHGYRTGHFGKWHLGTLTKTVKEANRGGPRGVAHFSPPQENGFDVCFSTESKVPTWDPMMKPPGGAQIGWNAIGAGEGIPYNTHYWDEDGQLVKENLAGANSRVIMDRAIPFIRESVTTKKPFFSVIWFHTPHLPVVAGPEYFAMYPDAKDDYHRNYYGCITAMDAQIGRLRDELRKLGVAENTLLTFCSDNGPEGNAKAPGSTGGFRGRKRSLYEGGVRVPGLIEWPAQIKPGTLSDFPASTSDYMPTILAHLGAKLPDRRPTDGIDLLPALQGKLATRHGHPIGFQSNKVASLVGHQYKLIGKQKQYELYNLLSDPHETRNIAADNPKIVRDMTKQLETWQASCKESDRGGDYARREAVIRFGAIADCQYADADTKGKRHYRLAAEKLEDAVGAFNADSELDFVIHLGDFIDRDFESYNVVTPIFNKLRAKKYHLLGNHDYEVSDELKSKVPAALGLDERYYDFAVGEWRFIVLDGNEFSTLAHPQDSEPWKEAEAFRTAVDPPLANYCGAIKPEQIAWLKARLDATRAAGQRAVLFCHYPLTPEGHHNLWNDTEMLEVLKPYNDVVRAWINGHNHAGGYAQRDGIHYLTLKGMLDTTDNAFATFEIFDDEIRITGHHREPDRVLNLGREG